MKTKTQSEAKQHEKAYLDERMARHREQQEDKLNMVMLACLEAYEGNISAGKVAFLMNKATHTGYQYCLEFYNRYLRGLDAKSRLQLLVNGAFDSSKQDEEDQLFPAREYAKREEYLCNGYSKGVEK